MCCGLWLTGDDSICKKEHEIDAIGPTWHKRKIFLKRGKRSQAFTMSQPAWDTFPYANFSTVIMAK